MASATPSAIRSPHSATAPPRNGTDSGTFRTAATTAASDAKLSYWHAWQSRKTLLRKRTVAATHSPAGSAEASPALLFCCCWGPRWSRDQAAATWWQASASIVW